MKVKVFTSLSLLGCLKNALPLHFYSFYWEFHSYTQTVLLTLICSGREVLKDACFWAVLHHLLFFLKLVHIFDMVS